MHLSLLRFCDATQLVSKMSKCDVTKTHNVLHFCDHKNAQCHKNAQHRYIKKIDILKKYVTKMHKTAECDKNAHKYSEL